MGVPVLERVIRSAVVYVFAVVALRIAGKRELSQVSTFDLVVLLFFANILQDAVIGDDQSVTGAMIGAATFLGLNYLVIRLIYNHERVDALIEGKATELIRDGEVQWPNLRRELVTLEELMISCHKQGIRDLSEVDLALLEPGGAISVFPKRPYPEEELETQILGRIAIMEDHLRDLRDALVREQGTDGREPGTGNREQWAPAGQTASAD
jgi:uncharacterized membrane protein YcaP (DUF421 family)